MGKKIESACLAVVLLVAVLRLIPILFRKHPMSAEIQAIPIRVESEILPKDFEKKPICHTPPHCFLRFLMAYSSCFT